MSAAATTAESSRPTELSLLIPNGCAPTSADIENAQTAPSRRMTDPSSTYRRVFTAGVTILIAALALVALSKNYLTNIDITEANRSADIYLLSSSHPWPCNEIMIGVWTKTCLVQTQGMISYNFVSLGDGSFAELQSDGLGFMSMYGTYIYTPGEVASSSQNCLADYTSHFKQEPLDRWRPAQGSLDYNTWYFGKDFFTNEPYSVSCRFERIKGQECRNRISRLLFHFANDGVALSQYQNAPEDLC